MPVKVRVAVGVLVDVLVGIGVLVGRGDGVAVTVGGIISVGSTSCTIDVGRGVLVGATVGVTTGIPPPQAVKTNATITNIHPR